MTIIPVPANSTRPLAYRALEVEQAMKRNMLVALGISVLIHALIIIFYHLLPSNPIDMSKVKFNNARTGSRTRTPSDLENYVLSPAASAAAPKITGVKAGKIVAVPDAIADTKITLATQDELKRGIALNGTSTDDAGAGVGYGVGDGTDGLPNIDLEEPEPEIYVAVERQPVLVRPVIPKYPEPMAKAGVQGTVWVQIWVNKHGKPHDVRIVKSDNKLFNDAAVKAAKQFLFTPAYMTGGPVSVWVTVPFRFRLK